MEFEVYICKYIKKQNHYKCIGVDKPQDFDEVLQLLNRRYLNPYLIEYLLGLGALQRVGERLGRKGEDDPLKSISYRRDLGYPGKQVNAFVVNSLKEIPKAKYIFLWKGGKWMLLEPPFLIP